MKIKIDDKFYQIKMMSCFGLYLRLKKTGEPQQFYKTIQNYDWRKLKKEDEKLHYSGTLLTALGTNFRFPIKTTIHNLLGVYNESDLSKPIENLDLEKFKIDTIQIIGKPSVILKVINDTFATDIYCLFANTKKVTLRFENEILSFDEKCIFRIIKSINSGINYPDQEINVQINK